MPVEHPTTYAVGGSRSNTGGNSGEFFRFTAGASGSRVTGSGSGSGLVPYHHVQEFYGGVGGFSTGVGPSAFHGVESSRGPYTVGPSELKEVTIAGDGSGGFLMGYGLSAFHGAESSCGLYTVGPSSYRGGAGDRAGANFFGGDVGTDGFSMGAGRNAFQRVRSSRGPFTVEPNSYLGDAHTFGGAAAYAFSGSGSDNGGYPNAKPYIGGATGVGNMASSSGGTGGGLSVRNEVSRK